MLNKVFSSTCHICLEDLSYKPENIKKKCCPTKAFICNGCWDSLNNNEWMEIHPQHISIIFDSLKQTGNDEIITNLALEILENLS